MFSIFILSSLVSLILILLNSLICTKSFSDREKISPFECGFNPQFYSRTPFSMQFFLIAIIFLIFDVEITLIMPIPMIFQLKMTSLWMNLSFFFFLILLIGLYHEWNQGALYWPK